MLEEYSYDTSETLQRQFTYGNYLDEVWTIDDRSGSITVAQLNDTTGSQRHFAHANTLYHVHGLTDEEGNLVEGYQYDAYGKATVFTGKGNDNTWFTSDDTPADWSAKSNPYQYTGQRYDPETHLCYYKNRYYDTDLGRFIRRDPIGYMDEMNFYEYANSRPIIVKDPLGLFGCDTQPPPHPRTPRQCCEAAAAQGLDNGNLGGIVCCDGRKVKCVWNLRISQNQNTGQGLGWRIISTCVSKHEGTHLDDVDCPKTRPHLSRPPFKPGKNPDSEECSAYRRELTCLRNMRSQCNTVPNPQDCQQIVDNFIRDSEIRERFHCGRAGL